MFNYIIKFFSPSRRHLEVPMAGLLLTAGILSLESKPVHTQTLRTLSSSLVAVKGEAWGKETVTVPRGKLPEKDGIYLYGQSPKPAQIGQEYIVVEVHQGKVTGAFYLPRSEFSCFSGTLQGGKLALMVAASPESGPYPDSVTNQNPHQVAAAGNGHYIPNGDELMAYPYSVALQDYYRLPTVSANDQRILGICKNNQQP